MDKVHLELLKKCQKPSKVKVPVANLFGKIFLSRISYVKDSDTISIVRCVEGELQKEALRIVGIDGPELKHKEDKDQKITEKETKLGCLAKCATLEWLLPGKFPVTDEDIYNDRYQKPIFDANPVYIQVECPLLNHLGKKMTADKYLRILGNVRKYNPETGTVESESLSDFLLKGNFGDNYYGGTKEKNFLKEKVTTDQATKQNDVSVVENENTTSTKTIPVKKPRVAKSTKPKIAKVTKPKTTKG